MSLVDLATTWKDALKNHYSDQKTLIWLRAQLFLADLHALVLRPKLFLRLTKSSFFPLLLIPV